MNSRACSSVRPWKTCTSAPPVNSSPSARTTSARRPSPAACSSAATTSATISCPNRLSGGSSITRTPRSPSRSSRALATELVGHPLELVLLNLLRLAGEPERVPASPRVEVHEGHRVLVRLDDLGGALAGRDRAEDAVVVGHRGSLYGYSQPTRLKWRYSPVQMRAISATTSG